MYKKKWRAKYRTSYVLDFEKINAIREEFLRRFAQLYPVFARQDATGKERMTELVRFLILHDTEHYLEERAQEFLEHENMRSCGGYCLRSLTVL